VQRSTGALAEVLCVDGRIAALDRVVFQQPVRVQRNGHMIFSEPSKAFIVTVEQQGTLVDVAVVEGFSLGINHERHLAIGIAPVSRDVSTEPLDVELDRNRLATIVNARHSIDIYTTHAALMVDFAERFSFQDTPVLRRIHNGHPLTERDLSEVIDLIGNILGINLNPQSQVVSESLSQEAPAGS